jgi:hypothetical protein
LRVIVRLAERGFPDVSTGLPQSLKLTGFGDGETAVTPPEKVWVEEVSLGRLIDAAVDPL